MSRSFDRDWNQSRPLTIEPNFLDSCDGNAVVSVGRTKVLCAASVEEKQPRWMTDKTAGWLSAEYSLMPASTRPRASRDRERISGRTQEIQRLIGRSLRQAVDLSALGPRTVWLDCDVLQADGGTRTAAITGAWVAAAILARRLQEQGLVGGNVMARQIAAISVGVVKGEPRVDLDYEEDSTADVDMNIVLTSQGDMVEIQGTAEAAPFSRDSLNKLIDGAVTALQPIFHAQLDAVERALR